MVRARSHLRTVGPYRPAVDAAPPARAAVARLSANENAHGPMTVALAAAQEALADSHRYPPDGAPALRSGLAARLGVDAAWLAVGCGSLDLLQQLFVATVGPGDDVVFDDPSFPEYGRLCAVFGGSAVRIPLAGFQLDLAGMAAAVTERARLVLVCNPHSPTGTAHGHDEIAGLLASVRSDCLVVLDEAYVDYLSPEARPDSLELVGQHDNLVVLRTFSKAYGLAGLRVGYAVAQPNLIELFAKVHLTFAVNRAAAAAALACLTDDADGELVSRMIFDRAERARLVTALRRLGAPVPTSEANFVYVPVRDDATVVAARLARRGVLVGSVSTHALRITIGHPEEHDRLIGLLATELRAAVDGSGPGDHRALVAEPEE